MLQSIDYTRVDTSMSKLSVPRFYTCLELQEHYLSSVLTLKACDEFFSFTVFLHDHKHKQCLTLPMCASGPLGSCAYM